MGMGGQHHVPAALSPGKTRYSLYRRLGMSKGPVWTGAENLAPTGIRSPDRPAPSESLYRLSCRRPDKPLRISSGTQTQQLHMQGTSYQWGHCLQFTYTSLTNPIEVSELVLFVGVRRCVLIIERQSWRFWKTTCSPAVIILRKVS